MEDTRSIERLCRLLNKKHRSSISVYLDVTYVTVEYKVFERKISNSDLKKIISGLINRPEYLVAGAFETFAHLQSVKSTKDSIKKHVILSLSRESVPESMVKILDFLTNSNHSIKPIVFVPLCILPRFRSINRRLIVVLNVRITRAMRISVIAISDGEFIIWREDILSDKNALAKQVEEMLHSTVQYIDSLLISGATLTVNIILDSDMEYMPVDAVMHSTSLRTTILWPNDLPHPDIKIRTASNDKLDDAIVAMIANNADSKQIANASMNNLDIKKKNFFIHWRFRFRIVTATLLLLVLIGETYDMFFSMPQLERASREASVRLKILQNELSALHNIYETDSVARDVMAIINQKNIAEEYPILEKILNPMAEIVSAMNNVLIKNYIWSYDQKEKKYSLDIVFVLHAANGHLEELRIIHNNLATSLRNKYPDTKIEIHDLRLESDTSLPTEIKAFIYGIRQKNR